MDRKHSLSSIASKAAGAFNGRVAASTGIIAIALLCSCAGEPPKTTVSQAQLSVNEAMQTKAAQLAPLELRKARDHLDDAKQAMQSKKYKEARRLAEKAIAEAELAEAKTDAQDAQMTLAELRETLKALREEATPK